MAKVHTCMDKDFDFKISHNNGEFKLKIEEMDALDMSRQFRKISDYFKSIARDKNISRLYFDVGGC